MQSSAVLVNIPLPCRNGRAMNASRALALEALYEATDGANWTKNTGWQIGTDPCDPSTPPFDGITCNGNQVGICGNPRLFVPFTRTWCYVLR